MECWKRWIYGGGGYCKNIVFVKLFAVVKLIHFSLGGPGRVPVTWYPPFFVSCVPDHKDP